MNQRRLALLAASSRQSSNPAYPESMAERHRRVAEVIKRVSKSL